MTHHRRHLDRARPVDDEPPVGRGPERERGPPHPGELELGAIPLASGRELDAGRDPARINSGPLPAVPRLERIESPPPGDPERETRPSGDGVYPTPRGREGASRSSARASARSMPCPTADTERAIALSAGKCPAVSAEASKSYVTGPSNRLAGRIGPDGPNVHIWTS